MSASLVVAAILTALFFPVLTVLLPAILAALILAVLAILLLAVVGIAVAVLHDYHLTGTSIPK